MEGEQYQKELFEIEKPKRSFPRLRKILYKTDFENRVLITITLDRLIFISIGIIMLMVIVFALGVERGRALRKEMGQIANQIAPAKKPRGESIASTPLEKAQDKASEIKPASAESAKTSVAQKLAAPQETNRPYTIIVVTFSRKDDALAEAARLKRDGFDAFVYQSDPYFQVRVGAYSAKEELEPALNRLRRMYKDAYVISK